MYQVTIIRFQPTSSGDFSFLPHHLLPKDSISFRRSRYTFERQFFLLFSHVKRARYFVSAALMPLGRQWERLRSHFLHERVYIARVIFMHPYCAVHHRTESSPTKWNCWEDVFLTRLTAICREDIHFLLRDPLSTSRRQWTSSADDRMTKVLTNRINLLLFNVARTTCYSIEVWRRRPFDVDTTCGSVPRSPCQGYLALLLESNEDRWKILMPPIRFFAP